MVAAIGSLGTSGKSTDALARACYDYGFDPTDAYLPRELVEAMGIKVDGMNLAEFAACDARWYYEVQAAQQAYQQGRSARQQSDQKKAAM